MSQPLHALAIANERRFAVAAARREIAAMSRVDGLRHTAHLLRDNDPRIQSATVGHLLRAVERIGNYRVGQMLQDGDFLSIAESKRIRNLTERQRNVLATVLERRARGSEWRKVAA